MKKLAAKQLLWICCLSFIAQLEARDREGYIRQYQDIAIAEMKRAGVPASIKMAQAILESADGTSYLATKGNNHFGIKCGSKWKGATIYRKDDDYDRNGNLIASCFRKYKNADESFMAHSDFLHNNNRYAFLFQYKKTDYRRWARGLKQAGYATSTTYSEKLIRIIEENNLYRLDNMKPLSPQLATTEPKDNPSTTVGSMSKPGKVFVFNGIKTVKARGLDTYKKIAKRNNISLSRLLKYNDLKGIQKLKKNEVVYLQPKRNSYRGDKQYHKVNDGEDMYSISQRYGIKLAALYKKNKLAAKQQPANGQRISLKKKVKQAPKLKTKERILSMPSGTKNKPSIGKPDQAVGAKYHMVQSGETLWAIAQKYNTTVENIKSLNSLSDNVIRRGQKLKIR